MTLSTVRNLAKIFRIKCGLSDIELQTLATYNAEIARGIVHTFNWKLDMQKLQTIFDKMRYTEEG